MVRFAVHLTAFASRKSFHWKEACLLALLTCTLTFTNASAQITVVATGDSLTNGYSSYLGDALAEAGLTNEVVTLASGGCDSARYVGRTLDYYTGTYRDFATETITHDPDVIIFMLGTNDAYRMASYLASDNLAACIGAFDTYCNDISNVFDIFDATINSNGRRPTVIISTLLPAVPHESNTLVTEFNWVIDTLLNPWLEYQAGEHRFLLKDMNVLIQQQENWQGFYSDSFHLRANNGAGYQWMVGEFADTIAAAVSMPVLAGDLNTDGFVDIIDLNILLIEWSKSGAAITDPRADTNNDGIVGIIDLNIVLIDWGKTGYKP